MFNRLVERLKEYESVVLGFSGGVDSSLLAYALKFAGIPYICITVQTPLQKQGELAQSAFFCDKYYVTREVLNLDVLAEADIVANPENRCYFCKRKIFSALNQLAEDRGFVTVADGSNVDDLGEYRPGRQAIKELGIKSPLIECGFTKADIRRVSKELGLITHDLPSSPCLATRIPYNTPLTKEALGMAEQGEIILESIGILDSRVRVHDKIARIEARDITQACTLLDEKVIAQLKSLGFDYITLDLAGYQKGSFDGKDKA